MRFSIALALPLFASLAAFVFGAPLTEGSPSGDVNIVERKLPYYNYKYDYKYKYDYSYNGYFPPVHKKQGTCKYYHSGSGTYTLYSTQVSGCPWEVVVPKHHVRPHYACDAESSSALISVNIGNCMNVCILSTSCPKQQSCKATSKGKLISINAFNCDQVTIGSGSPDPLSSSL